MEKEENKSVFVEWAEITTAHGFVDFVKARSCCGKVTWTILLLSSISGMVYQIGRTCITFKKHSWSTSIQDLPPTELDFPSLIICNPNRIKYSKAQAYGMSDDMISYMLLSLMRNPTDTFIPKLDYSAEQAFIAWRKFYNLTFTSIFDKLAPSCEDIFIKDVCDRFLVKPLDSIEYGRCYRVELNSTANNVGSKSGYTFALNVQSSDYLPMIANNIIVEGLVMQLRYNGRIEYGQWTHLHPGTLTSVGMKVGTTALREEEKTIWNPFSYLAADPPCIREPNMTFFDPSQYSITNCRLECYQKLSVKSCKCVSYIQSSLYRTCEIEEINNCSGTTKNLTKVNGTNSVELNACFATCQKPCQDRTINTQFSISKFPSQAQRNSWMTWLNSNRLNNTQLDDIIMLEIYFDSLVVTQTEIYEEMSFDNFVSTCGGLIGLYIGMSFLTIFQAIDYFMKYCRLLKERKKKKIAIKPDVHEIQNSTKRYSSDLVDRPSVSY